ncbi:class I SAM-dependent methyltransferase [Gemmatimonas sp.]|jgi:ubiquinone/menaquinone biosynthesis C-methylase UbiE|uniref:class I SAM-dependent methyltransferase n=1 Tax=Gemmatimonas sp. TaxID=1962908 RepID=UPI0037BEE116
MHSNSPWWATQFDQQYLHEYEPLFDLGQDRREVARLLEVLALPSGTRVLDCPCGQGRHAHLLAEAGFNVDALDYSATLLDQARARGTGTTLRYTQGDMRALPGRWSGRFDAVVNLFTSFGFFDEPQDDLRVLAQFARVLKPGGVLVWHGGARDGVMAKFLSRDWWSSADGTMFGQERHFDPLSGFLEITSTWRGPKGHGERSHRIRLYTASELASRMRDVGLVVEQAFDSWSPRPLHRKSSEMMLVARKDG